MKGYLVAGLLVFAQACQSAGAAAVPKNYLVTAEPKGNFTAEQLKQSYGQLAVYIKNGYTAFRITYNTTDENGRDVIASGALFVPDTRSSLPLLNYNHGTLFPSQEGNAPSYVGNHSELMIGKLFSAAGYLVVMPDYIGYGSTKSAAHPYGAYHLIASSVIDMLRAAREYCEKNKITLSGKNFFSGWSEGAAVALATVKMLEEQYKGEFVPTAAVLNAGPYYTSGFADYVLDTKEPLNYIRSYVWILQSYNRIYGINRPMNYYFNEAAASAIAAGPNADISKDPQKLFSPSFIQKYKAGKDTALQNAMKNNDLWNWKPLSKIVFCHGDKDEYVPLFNSEKAYTEMKAKGADVTLKIFKGQTHSSGAFHFLQQAFLSFEGAK